MKYFGISSASNIFIAVIIGLFFSFANGTQIKDLLRGPNVCPIHPLCKFLALSNTQGRQFYQCRPSEINVKPQCIECKLSECYSDIPVFTQKALCDKLSACSVRGQKPTPEEIKTYSQAYAILWQCTNNLDSIDRCEPCDSESCDQKKTWWESKSECETFDSCQYGEPFEFGLNERDQFRPPIQIIPSATLEGNRVESENLIQVGSGEEPAEIKGKRIETDDSQFSEGFIPVVDRAAEGATFRLGRTKPLNPTRRGKLETETIDPCNPRKLRASCEDGSKPQLVIRWYAREGQCVTYSYGYCPGTPVVFDIPIRTKQECESMCLLKS